jgi:hypothetical protein
LPRKVIDFKNNEEKEKYLSIERAKYTGKGSFTYNNVMLEGVVDTFYKTST